ncbi:hypothetical protein B0H67DRAFT_304095 [Lasiosphaeris hirsuta]|uniref:Secreted protein n=1 Tax=Lasiosphaeris hirsuta TaxID=260670 RepID=A0AA40A9Y6_9PEZI|nr:hypothetical protein B0H67DRAFT_304095 [Lasiosphaeris hirsuta]
MPNVSLHSLLAGLLPALAPSNLGAVGPGRPCTYHTTPNPWLRSGWSRGPYSNSEQGRSACQHLPTFLRRMRGGRGGDSAKSKQWNPQSLAPPHRAFPQNKTTRPHNPCQTGGLHT